VLEHGLQCDQYRAGREDAAEQQQRAAGSAAASQSTMRPSMANSSASNAPITAVQSVIARMYGRIPSAQAHRNAKKLRGGATGVASGYGLTRFSNQRNTGDPTRGRDAILPVAVSGP
jgi:hypothetical protein